MKLNKFSRVVTGGAAALMLTAGVVWTADSSYAASLMQEVAQETQTQVGSTLHFVRHGGDRSGSLGNQPELLAAALNVSVEQLEAAKAAAQSAAIDQALAEGLITQEQADAIRERNENSGRIARIPGDTIDHDALLANALGISVEQLEAAEETAFTNGLNQAVAEGTITQDEAELKQAQQSLKEYLNDSTASTREEAIQQAVLDGVITQKQADLFLNSGRSFDGGGPRGREGEGRGNDRANGNETNGTRFQSPPNTDNTLSNL